MANKYQNEIDSFIKNFSKFKEKRIALYGIGRYTATLLPEISDFNIVGLMDRDPDNIGKSIHGISIISSEDAKAKVDLIIINTTQMYWQIIFNRIERLGIPVYYLNGERAIGNMHSYNFKENEYWNYSLEDIYTAIKKNSIVSFDMFDTLVVRSVYYPQDIFEIVEQRYCEQFGYRINIKRERIEAGQYANDNNWNIDDIYDYIHKKNLFTREELNRVKAIEILTELENCKPRSTMVEIYNSIKDRKKIIVTDMYLPLGSIISILNKCGIQASENEIVLSCNVKANKKDGEIWKYIRNKYPREKIIHIGDNWNSDAKLPKKYGIETFYVMSVSKMLEESSIRSCSLNITDLSQSINMALISNKLFDDPFRLSKTKGYVEIASLEELGYVLFGGLIYKFLSTIHQSAIRTHKNRILFFLRDGYLMKNDFELICKLTGINIQSELFPISRRLILLSSCDGEDIELVKFPYVGIFRDYLLDRFDIEVDPYDENKDKQISLPNDFELVCVYLKPYDEQIKKKIKYDKANYSKYLNMVKVCDDDAVVDLWYYGNNQYYLEKMIGNKVDGYYMLLNKNETNVCHHDRMYAVLQREGDKDGKGSVLKNSDLFIESMFTAPFGMIKAIGEEGNLICSECRSNQRYFDERNSINNGIREYIKDYYLVQGKIELGIDSVEEIWTEFANDNIGIIDEIKEIFFYDNALVHRNESKIFGK